MGRLIIEVATRHGARPRFESFYGGVSVGRAYDNNLILADRSVSAHHLRVRALSAEERDAAQSDSDGGSSPLWCVEDLGSENGILFGRRSLRNTPLRIGPGDELIVGRTRLRFFTPDHPVAPVESLRGAGALFDPSRPLLAWAIVLFSLFVTSVLSFLSSDGYETSETVAFAVVGAGVLAVSWAAVWALVGRVLRHRPAFSAHAAVACAAFALSALADEIGGWLGFAVPRIWVAPLFVTFALFAVGLTTVVVSLRLATNLRPIVRWSAGLAIATLLSAGVLFAEIDPLIDTSYPVYSSQLRPVPAALIPTESIDDFFEDANRVFRP